MAAGDMALSAAARAADRAPSTEERDTWRFALLSRLLPAGFFLLLLVAKVLELVAFARQSSAAPVGPAFAAGLAYRLSAISFLCLVVALFLIRTRPLGRAAGLRPALIAIGGAFIMTIVAFLGGASLPPLLLATATALLIGGNCISVAALWWLGRSFSILPEARRLVTGGPYRLVRHPIYLGEIAGGAGLALHAFSWPALLIWLLFIALQVRRMAYEEAVLARTFSPYADYMKETARLIPGVY